ncbi:MAG: YqeG family HAD IIIA-type phosphatase [Candidatus Gastranaerophilales bacterium]|nr:YqeG family HAD IIIA-type phosphatase [Candidatus Gastranaerophilales bacterium]
MILKPDYNVVSLFDIDFDELKNQGVNVVLFDLDSTIMPSKSGMYPENVKELFKKLKNDFTLAVISNNKNKDYIAKVQAMTDFAVVGHANKPSPKVMREYLLNIGKSPKDTVVIGDRPLTDILAGKLLGAKTVLVDSITKNTENIQTRLVRKLERTTIRTF